MRQKILLLAAMVVASSTTIDAQRQIPFFWKKKKIKTEQTVPAKKGSEYGKLFKKGYYVTHRHITTQQPLVFYIDTLIQDGWVKAIQESADEWNIIFEDVTAYNITDLRTREILSSKIGVPRDLAASVHRNRVYQMAEVDPRFQTYYIADEVFCENRQHVC